MTPAPGLPRWVYVPAAIGAVLIVLPLLALVVKADWGQFPALVTGPASRAALLLSVRTCLASTALCLMFGVPLAVVLARGPGRLTRLLRPMILLPLVLPPVVGGIALLYAFGKLGLLGHYLDAARDSHRVFHVCRGAGADLCFAAVPGHQSAWCAGHDGTAI